ncbi:MAG TPA: hypothetical protein VH062_33545 [Polyangiaceae bacterium]|nr:hypothetical protein [Polyangiaceae bacterium]
MDRGSTGEKQDRLARWALFAFGVAVILLRYPDLSAEPRIWGEEGSIYLRDAYAKPWQETLFAPALGYFGLFSSVPSTVAANLVPLEYVATFMAGVGFVTQLVPVGLVVWGKAPLWRSLATRLVGLCVLLFNPLGEELWLNTTCIQFHFVMTAFLVFLEPDEGLSKNERWVRRGLLALSGLAGPPPCSLSPLFALRAYVTRHREAVVRAVILGAATVLQLVIVVYGMTKMVGRTDRFGSGFDLATAAVSTFGKSFVVPFFGVGYGTSFALAMQQIEQAGPGSYRLAGLACAWALGLVLYFVSRGSPRWERVAYMGSAGLLVASSMVLGIGDRRSWVFPACAARYYYAPGVILMLFVLSRLDLRAPRAFTRVQQVLALALVVGLGFQVAEWRTRIIPPAGEPHWRHEVAEFRSDPSHPLGIWPAGWTIPIPKKSP